MSGFRFQIGREGPRGYLESGREVCAVEGLYRRGEESPRPERGG